MARRKVMLAYPNTGNLHVELVKSLVKIITDTSHEVHFQFDAPVLKCNENNYQNIAKKFWESDSEFLLQIDSDNPPMKNPLPLCDLGLDIISLPTPTWKYCKEEGEDYNPLQWNAYEKVRAGVYRAKPPGRGLERVDAAGAGCVLIHRRVFEAPLMKREGWHRKWNKENGTADLGLDLAFCERATKCGFEIYTHWDYPCRHFNTVDLATFSDGFKQWANTLGLVDGKERLEEKESPLVLVGAGN